MQQRTVVECTVALFALGNAGATSDGRFGSHVVAPVVQRITMQRKSSDGFPATKPRSIMDEHSYSEKTYIYDDHDDATLVVLTNLEFAFRILTILNS